MPYAIVTDSCANLTDELIHSLGIEVLPLMYRIGSESFLSYEHGRVRDLEPFYVGMRRGQQVFTSCIEAGRCKTAITELLDKGLDVLFIGFASALSVTYQVACMVLEQLRPDYPERKLVCVDSVSGSLGQGLLVVQAAKMQRDGCTLEQVRDWLEENKLSMCHWFTVEDLKYLRRGGRIGAAAASLGGILGIRPVLRMDVEGKLVGAMRVRGRKMSLDALADRFVEMATDPRHQIVGIAHGDCEEAAQYLMQRIRERTGAASFVVNHMDPVIGAHAGPGSVALFFFGRER